MTTQDDKTPDEIDLLLPWHVVERLSPEETERVEAALRSDPERARHLDIAREERAETVALNQGLGLPSRAARDALFARIEAEGRKPRAVGLMGRLRDRFASLSPAALAWSGTAAALVIALQAGFLASAYRGTERPGYETASTPTAQAQDGQFAIVAFAPGATADRIDALLRDTHATIVDGPRAGGLYRLRLADKATDAKTVAALVERLKAETGVIRLVAPEAPTTGR